MGVSKKTFKLLTVRIDNNKQRKQEHENTGKKKGGENKEDAQRSMHLHLIKQPAGREAGKKQMSDVRDQ